MSYRTAEPTALESNLYKFNEKYGHEPECLFLLPRDASVETFRKEMAEIKKRSEK